MPNKLTIKNAIKTVLIGSTLLASSQTVFAEGEPIQPLPPLQPHERQPFFGDLHVHTKYSLDSYIYGNTNTPDEAYQFAKGEKALPIGGTDGMEIMISKPLDFAAVTDHAETMAEYELCTQLPEGEEEPVCKNPEGLESVDSWENSYCSDTCVGVRGHDISKFYDVQAELRNDNPQRDPEICPPTGTVGETDSEICHEASKKIWEEFQDVANDHNVPGQFTTFIAYEHSPYVADGGTFHRNVIFRGTEVSENVISAYDAYTASDFWKQLDDSCANNEDKENCEALVIPHNSDLSSGMFFATTDRLGEPYTLDDYQLREKLEPLIEIHQAKGNSECLLGAGTTDEFCQFEMLTYPCDNVGLVAMSESGKETFNCREDSYVRNGLKKGLKLAGEQDMNGHNPFKYGFIGSTDNHNATPGLTEEFQAIVGSGLKTPEERLAKEERINNPGGLAGVWAEENTRDALFDAMKRKETFATSGSRITVRFFGGWNYQANLHKYPKETMLKEAYGKGVPMGGDMTNHTPLENGRIPKFLVWATKDPLSANLQRLQIIKGWTDANGTHEAVYDVACSDGLRPDEWTHLCPDNGAQVDSACNPSTNKGATELKATWYDPDFDPSQRAFYYARVLENPTCRWSTYSAKTLGIEPLKDVPPTIQERAWSSPIWYNPLRLSEIKEFLQGVDKKELLKKVIQLLKAKKPILQAVLENRSSGSKQLPSAVIETALKGKTISYQNLHDGLKHDVLFTMNGKRIIYSGPDQMVTTYYEIRDDQLYQRSGNKEYGTSIYRVRGESEFRYIACDSRDNGYCNWEITLP